MSEQTLAQLLQISLFKLAELMHEAADHSEILDPSGGGTDVLHRRIEKSIDDNLKFFMDNGGCNMRTIDALNKRIAELREKIDRAG